MFSYEWTRITNEEAHREHRISDSITQASVMADKVRFLIPEALDKIPKWTHELKFGSVLSPAGRVDYLITIDAVIPYTFIQDFLARSSFTKLQKIGNYSDKTQGREWAQALTDELVRQGYALPANSNEPALWLSGDSRARFAQELGVELDELNSNHA
jgi:hypothetical protein